VTAAQVRAAGAARKITERQGRPTEPTVRQRRVAATVAKIAARQECAEVVDVEVLALRVLAAPGVWFEAPAGTDRFRATEYFEMYADNDGRLFVRRHPRPSGLPR